MGINTCDECGVEITGNKALCDKCYQAKYRAENPRKIKMLRVKHQLGITLEDYEEAMKTSHCCEICGSEKRLCYDHDHNTSEFRGVLCVKCNKGLGLLGDSIESINRAVLYLRNSKKRG